MTDRFVCSKGVCIGAAFLGLIGLAAYGPGPDGSRASELRRTPIVKAVQSARPSVVNIRGEKTLSVSGLRSADERSGQQVNGMGTGVVIDARGYIVTNFHVVDGIRQISVTLFDGRKHVGRLIARDTETDLAVIKIDPAADIPSITFGTSSDLMPGETVLAVGNAFGYEHTVTRGIISALKRAVQVSDVQYYDDLIQTDASINPGNSGGPLLNIDGEMIGINVAVRAGAQGIGFAIPVDKAVSVVTRMLSEYNVRNAWHGIVPADDGTASSRGAVVASVAKESPAAKAGLETGDRITRVGRIDVERNLDFHRAMLNRKAGETIELLTRRDDKPLTLKLTLAGTPRKQDPWSVLGLELRPISAKEFRRKHNTRYRGGLSVTNVRPGGPASGQGIRRGDVLVGMHIWETISTDNVTYILKRSDLATLSPIKFFILRGDETLYGHLSLAAKTARRK